MTALEQESGANRALVAYYFKDKAGLVAAIVDSLFSDPDTPSSSRRSGTSQKAPGARNASSSGKGASR